jgi:hypothetical protein
MRVCGPIFHATLMRPNQMAAPTHNVWVGYLVVGVGIRQSSTGAA